MKPRKRSQRRGPVVGGLVGEDNTKQGRRRRARKDAAEMAARVRKDIKIPTTKEVMEVERSKAT